MPKLTISEQARKVLEALANLSDRELRQVQALSTFLINEKHRKTSETERGLFQALREEFATRNVHVPVNWLNAVNGTYASTWRNHLEALGPVLAAFKVGPATPLANGVYRLLWGLLIENEGI